MAADAPWRGAAESQCKRFRRDGSRCTNPTVYADGWCRSEDCPGYTRPSTELAPEKSGGARGLPRHIRETGDVPVGDGSVDFTLVRISPTAVDAFVRSHGGSADEARVQLRSMLEDFLLRSARRPTERGNQVLAHSGYELVMSPNGHALLGYRTVHRERTWAQVKAGVPSRFPGKRSVSKGGSHRRAELGERPEPGEPLSLDAVASQVHAHSVHLTWRARSSYSKIAKLGQADDEDLDQAIRTSLEESMTSGTWLQRDDGHFELLSGDLVWLLAADGRTLIGIKKVQAHSDLTSQHGFEAR